jgi:UDP-N-acetylglucosamine 2-epimerase
MPRQINQHVLQGMHAEAGRRCAETSEAMPDERQVTDQHFQIRRVVREGGFEPGATHARHA